MCFGPMSAVEQCDVCGRHHPGGPVERCADVAAATAAVTLEDELDAYLRSREAEFFGWLARRARAA